MTVRLKTGKAIALAFVFAICLSCGMAGCSCASKDVQGKTSLSASDKLAEGGISSSKPVAKIEESEAEDGTRTIVYTFTDGTTQTLVVGKDGEDSGSAALGDTASGGERGVSSAVSGELPGDGSTEYEKFMALSPEEQEAYFETFESPQAFIDWFNAVKADYQAAHPMISVREGDVFTW